MKHKVLIDLDFDIREFTDMTEGLETILHDACIKERKLNLLYSALVDSEKESEEEEFFRKACDDQEGTVQVLQEISRNCGNIEIDPGILEKLGESVKQLKAKRRNREDLLRESLACESDLVEHYKQSLRYLTNDDQTRKLVNAMLTVKLGHKRDLLDMLNK